MKLDERGMLYAESYELMSFYTISFDFYNRKIFNHKQQKSKIKLELDPKKTSFQLDISKKQKNRNIIKILAAIKYHLRLRSF